MMPAQCRQCYQGGVKLGCVRCGTPYCSTACQTKHWPQHRINGCVNRVPQAELNVACRIGNDTGATHEPLTEAVVTVSGHSDRVLAPDWAMLQLAVEAETPNITSATHSVTHAMANIANKLQDLQVDIQDQQTTNYQVVEVYKDRRLPDGSYVDQVRIGYRVRNALAVKIRDLANIASILDGVIYVGGDTVRIKNIAFQAEIPQSLKNEMLTEAASDAQQRATRMVDAVNQHLGRLVRMNERRAMSSTYGSGLRTAPSFTQHESAPSTFVAPGQITVQVSVDATFAVQPLTIAR